MRRNLRYDIILIGFLNEKKQTIIHIYLFIICGLYFLYIYQIIIYTSYFFNLYLFNYQNILFYCQAYFI